MLKPTFADNILDLVITEDLSRIFTILYGPPLGTSAKNRLRFVLERSFVRSLFWNYNLKYSDKLSIQTKNKILFHQCEFNKFRLSIESWSEETATLDMDPNLEYEKLLSAYNEATSKYIPVKSVQVNQSILNNPKWFNKLLKKLTSLKYKLHCRLRASPNNKELLLQYKNQCPSVKAAVCASIFAFEENLVNKCKSNPKLLFKYVNSQTNWHEKIKMLVNKSGEKLVERAAIANCLND